MFTNENIYEVSYNKISEFMNYTKNADKTQEMVLRSIITKNQNCMF